HRDPQHAPLPKSALRHSARLTAAPSLSATVAAFPRDSLGGMGQEPRAEFSSTLHQLPQLVGADGLALALGGADAAAAGAAKVAAGVEGVEHRRGVLLRGRRHPRSLLWRRGRLGSAMKAITRRKISLSWRP